MNATSARIWVYLPTRSGHINLSIDWLLRLWKSWRQLRSSDASAASDWKLTLDDYYEIFTVDTNAGVIWTRYAPSPMSEAEVIRRYKDIPVCECLIEIDKKGEDNIGRVIEKNINIVTDDPTSEGGGYIEISLESDDLPGDRAWWYEWKSFIRKSRGERLATLGPKTCTDLLAAVNESILASATYLGVTPKEFITCIQEKVALESLARLGKRSR